MRTSAIVAGALVNRAMAYARQMEFDKARVDIDKAIDIYSRSVYKGERQFRLDYAKKIRDNLER